MTQTPEADQPDVVLMAIDMPGQSGIEAVSAGAMGYLLKKTPGNRLIDALRDVAAGGAVMTPTIAAKLLGTFQPPKRPAAGEWHTFIRLMDRPSAR